MAKAAKKKMAKGKARKPAKKAKSAAKKKVPAVPPGYHTVTPYLVCRGTAEAIEFYKKAFGAKERVRMAGPGGSVAHAELKIGDSHVMLGDEMPSMGSSAPPTVGGTSVHVFLYVKDVDKAFAQATAAGASVEMPPQDMFWGDRYCKLVDPFGHKWGMATHFENVSPKEMARRSAEWMAKMAQHGG